MNVDAVPLHRLIRPAKVTRAGTRLLPILSMTMRNGLVDQASKFKKRIASVDTSSYKVVCRRQLVVGFPIDEGVLSFQDLYDEAIVSPAYDVWELNPEQSIDPRYLERFLRSPLALSYYSRKLRGTTARRRTIPDDVFLRLEVPLPERSEQGRIADLIDKAETIDRKRKSGIALTEELLHSTFLQMFGDPVTNPKGWEVRPLGTFLGFVTSGSRGWAEHYSERGARFIRSLDVQMDRISDEDPVYVAAPLGAEAERTRVRPDDVLLTITGSKIGRAALVKETDAGAYVSQHVAILRVLPGLDPDVLTAFLVCDRGGQRLIARAQYGQTKPGLNLAQIRAFPVPIPPEELQARVRAVRLEIRQLHRRLEEGLRSTDGLIRSLTYGAFHWSHGSTTPRPAGAGDSEAE